MYEMPNLPYVPKVSYRIFEPGTACANAKPGDVVLVEHPPGVDRQTAARLIRVGQRIRYGWYRFLGKNGFEAHYCNWSHAATVINEHGAIVEMALHGGRVALLSEFTTARYAVVHFEESTQAQVDAAVNAATLDIGVRYAILSFIGLGIGAFLGGWNLVIGSGTQKECSAAACLAARCHGLIPDRNDICVMPADLARYFKIEE